MDQIIVIALVAVVLLAIIFVKKSIVIISQSETKIIERLGKYYATLNPGINVIIPFIDQPKPIVALIRGRYVYTHTIDLREQVYDFDKQNVITKDNIQMQINALLYFQIVDPFKAVYEINNLPNAIEKLTQTTLRNIIGEMELDQTLTSRDTINTKLRAVLDDATNKCCRLWKNRCRPSVTSVPPFLPLREKSRPSFCSRKARKPVPSTVPRLLSSKKFCVPRARLRRVFVKPRPRPLR